jgi:CheY-like chemotaxis protein
MNGREEGDTMERRPRRAISEADHAGARGGAQESEEAHIMIVDDHEQMCAFMERVLRRLGYRVTTFQNATKGLASFQKKPSEWDLVVTDRFMPNLSGEMLIERLLEIRPDIPVVLFTGESGCEDPQQGGVGARAVLHKPATVKEIQTVVDRLLADDKHATQPGSGFRNPAQ